MDAEYGRTDTALLTLERQTGREFYAHKRSTRDGWIYRVVLSDLKPPLVATDWCPTLTAACAEMRYLLSVETR